MQNMKISDPFDKDPPQNLNEAAKVFTVSTKYRYKHFLEVIGLFFFTQGAKMKAMMEEMENKNLMEQLKEGLTPHGLSSFRTDFKSPAEFFDDQIFPVNGLVAYGGCFSNHFQWTHLLLSNVFKSCKNVYANKKWKIFGKTFSQSDAHKKYKIYKFAQHIIEALTRWQNRCKFHHVPLQNVKKLLTAIENKWN